MSIQAWALPALATYLALFLAASLGFSLRGIKRKRERPPMPFKLLRGPGESLRRRMEQFDENLPPPILVGLIPICAALAVLQLLVHLTPRMPLWQGLTITGAVGLPVLACCGKFVADRFQRLRNDRLGYLGERAVGEALEPLKERGYRLFHDVPANESGRKFNVDHVAIGPTGIFAIETKTRRKGRGRPNYEQHKVAYDGRQLIWPWAEDSFGLDQAEAQAAWLSTWLNKMTGLGIRAQPVLALPGWYVVPKGIGPVMVLNEKLLVGAISRPPTTFSAQQIDLIARQLDQVCRDVED